MLKKPNKKQKLGRRGEYLACLFLMKHGHRILRRNYTKRSGEIDIITEKEGIWHFIEVKSVSRETFRHVSHETNDQYRPEDNVDYYKMLHVKRTVEIFLFETGAFDRDMQIDVVTVTFYKNRELPVFNYIENVI